MPKIIYIETSTDLCSTALTVDGRLVSYRESSEPRVHASMTAVYIDEMLREAGLRAGECDAVCVAKGPGSYTGLRVGVSTAKGLCFGAGIPLLSVGTLDTLFWQALSEAKSDTHTNDNTPADTTNFKETIENQEIKNYDKQSSNNNSYYKTVDDQGIKPYDKQQDNDTEPIPYIYIVPLIDARRMEVYTQTFRSDGTKLNEPEAKIIDEDSFADLLSEGPVLFIGDAADKCAKVITHPNARFLNCRPKASSMIVPAERAFAEKRFEDVAYFEPFYLKTFVATVSNKSLW
ncbi:MAG: tRNA (adenosine(37)-N6)-threonylcarbamoyltransferase complex dimerization subunit type 1 TsaB [Bacteroidales bacterium]|nr:tRNA (adenosine(37)-N6)-threonylcarbamoyltransferase complex dimerization subunit type 1 TsaB [Bacteroidales bacterium]